MNLAMYKPGRTLMPSGENDFLNSELCRVSETPGISDKKCWRAAVTRSATLSAVSIGPLKPESLRPYKALSLKSLLSSASGSSVVVEEVSGGGRRSLRYARGRADDEEEDDADKTWARLEYGTGTCAASGYEEGDSE